MAAVGERDSDRGLEVKVTEAFTKGDSRGEDGVPVTIRVGAGRHAEAHECGENVVAVLLVGGEDSILHQERPVSEAVGAGRLVTIQPPGDTDYDFDILERDQLHSLAGAEIVGRDTIAHRLEVLVIAQFFFQPGGDGDQRSYPVRLLTLDLGHAWKPVQEIILHRGPELLKGLCMARRRDEYEDSD